MNLSIKDIYVKHSLGKIVLLLLVFTLLQAKDFDYSLHVDKTNPYLKEAVILTVDVNQTNHDIVLLFDFDVAKSDDYTFQRIDIKEVDAYHAVQIQYTYLIYPLKEGKVDIRFHLTQKATTDESVAYSFSGDRDNVKGLVTENTDIKLPPVALQVKSLPIGTQLVGDFTLDYKVKSLKAKAYEPLPFQVTIKGLGYPPLLKTLLPKDANFTRFTETPLVSSIASRQGTHSTVTYPMALSHSKSFTLAPITIKAFNPNKQKSYTLDIPAQHFSIQEVDQNTLIDTMDTPSVLKADWTWIQTLFTYLIVFIAGYLSALFMHSKYGSSHKRKHKKALHPLIEKIEQSKTEKALLQVLMAQEDKRFTNCIEKLEGSLYGDQNIHFKQVKQEALEKIV